MSRKAFVAPVSIDLSITDACNLRCSYCYADAGPSKFHYINLEKLKGFVKEVVDLGVHYIRIAGGEPLLHPDILEILEYISSYPIITSMSTNGILVTDDVTATLNKIKFPWVVVSLDGHIPQINNLSRGKWHETVKGIKLLINAGIRTKTATVLTSKNVEYLEYMLDYFSELGVYSSGFLMFCPVGRGGSNLKELELDKEQTAYAINVLTKYKMKNSNGLKVNFVPPHESKIPWELRKHLTNKELKDIWGMRPFDKLSERTLGCNASISTCSINSRGDMFGCEQLINFPELCAGNVFDTSIKELWDKSKVFSELRDVNIKNIASECVECELLECGGGCRAIAYSQTNSLYGMDTRCKI